MASLVATMVAALPLSLDAVEVSPTENQGVIRDRNGEFLGLTDSVWLRERVLHVDSQTVAPQLLQSLSGAILPKRGTALYLTIDRRAQTVAETELLRAGGGSAAVIDASSGEVLALVGAAQTATLPGATFQMVTAMATNAGDASRGNWECKGNYPSVTGVRLCGGEAGHGRVSISQAIAIPCNAAFAAIGRNAGPDAIARVARLAGLGRPSQLPLRAETAGAVRSLEWMKSDPSATARCTAMVADFANGQSLVYTTPLQMARVAGAIAMNGSLVQPRILIRVTRDDREVLRTKRRVVNDLRREGVSESTLAAIRAGLDQAIPDLPGIAGRAATVPAAAGKNSGWFAGYTTTGSHPVAIAVSIPGATGPEASHVALMILGQL